jgi:hypothetical protein
LLRCISLGEACRFILLLLNVNRNAQGQERPLLFDHAKTLVADLLGREGGGGGNGGSSSFDAVQVPHFPSEGYISFAAETYLR